MNSKANSSKQDCRTKRNASDDEPLLELDIEESDTGESVASVSEGSGSSPPGDGSLSDSSASEIDIDLESKKTGELGSLAQQAKILRSELQRTQDWEDESEHEKEGGDLLGWGSRQQFYGTNELDKQGEEGREDLEETLERQRADLEQLQDADFELPATDTAQEHVMDVDKDDENTDGNHHQELASLYSTVQQSLAEVRCKLEPLLKEARKGDLCTEEGLTYLEVKHLLLLHYSMCIVFYLLLKIEGTSVKDHPVLMRLVEIRAYLEKLRPLEARLQPQVEKLLRAVAMAKDDDNEEAEEEETLAPHPEDLVSKTQEEGGVYRPPRMNPVSMDDDSPKKTRKRRGKKEAVDNDMVSEIVRELTGAPEERSSGGNPIDRMKSILAERRAAEWSQLEEDIYTRSNPGKQEKKRMVKQSAEAFGGMSFAAFAEDIQNAVEAIQESKSLSLPTQAEKQPVLSGDADLPFQEPKRRETVVFTDIPSSDAEEDRVAKKAKKTAEKRTSHPPKPVKTTKGRRAISDVIQKNRGLTPHRSKERKNPRRRHRLQFEDKEKKRKGQIQKAFSEAPDHYGGEASGISKRVKKSVRFG